MSERDPKTGKWSAKKVSKEALYWPDAGYAPASTFPTWAVDYLTLRYWAFPGAAGDLITVTQGFPSHEENGNKEDFVGAFAVLGH